MNTELPFTIEQIVQKAKDNFRHQFSDEEGFISRYEDDIVMYLGEVMLEAYERGKNDGWNYYGEELEARGMGQL